MYKYAFTNWWTTIFVRNKKKRVSRARNFSAALTLQLFKIGSRREEKMPGETIDKIYKF